MKDIRINGCPLWLFTLINLIMAILIFGVWMFELKPEGFLAVYFYMGGWCIAWWFAREEIRGKNNV